MAQIKGRRNHSAPEGADRQLRRQNARRRSRHRDHPGHGIARLHGLDKVMSGELLEFPHGMPSGHEPRRRPGRLRGSSATIPRSAKAISQAHRQNSQRPRGDAMIGRVNALGQPIDDMGPSNAATRCPSSVSPQASSTASPCASR